MLSMEARQKTDSKGSSSKVFLRSCIALLLLGSCATSSSIIFGNVDRYLPFSAYLYGDSEVYINYAEALLAGNQYDAGIPFHPPFTAWLCAAILSCGITPENLKFVFLVFSLATTWLTFDLTRHWFGLLSGMLAGTLAGLSFGIAVVSFVPSPDGPYLFLLMLSMWLIVRWQGSLYTGSIILGGLGGIACLTRGEHILLAPVLAGIWWFRWYSNPLSSTSRSRFAALALCLTSTLGVVSPWCLRNYKILTAFNAHSQIQHPQLQDLPVWVPITLYGPINFALANSTVSDGSFSREALPDPTGNGVLNLSHPIHRKWILEGYSIGFEYLSGNPKHAVWLLFEKLKIASGAFEIGFTSGSYPTGLTGVRRPIDLFAPATNWFRWIILLGVGIGWFLTVRFNRFAAVLLISVIIHRVVTSVAFYGYVRHGVLLLPIMFCLIGAILTNVQNPKRSQMLLKLMTAIIILSLFYHIVIINHHRAFSVKYNMLPGTQRIDHQLSVQLQYKGLEPD